VLLVVAGIVAYTHFKMHEHRLTRQKAELEKLVVVSAAQSTTSSDGSAADSSGLANSVAEK